MTLSGCLPLVLSAMDLYTAGSSGAGRAAIHLSTVPWIVAENAVQIIPRPQGAGTKLVGQENARQGNAAVVERKRTANQNL